ncbi:hypothetical protein NP493_990g00001 [Ridgeia piscesae]|uniref:Uncharacterized protein n=1 Tax=Ridgeia piscesae TaxID=27915 RepID=A0AAD9KJ60_RIDPI|nr:hypothetical protein NP493_990g00001 [Ridgeia piscesae]
MSVTSSPSDPSLFVSCAASRVLFSLVYRCVYRAVRSSNDHERVTAVQSDAGQRPERRRIRFSAETFAEVSVTYKILALTPRPRRASNASFSPAWRREGIVRLGRDGSWVPRPTLSRQMAWVE